MTLRLINFRISEDQVRKRLIDECRFLGGYSTWEDTTSSILIDHPADAERLLETLTGSVLFGPRDTLAGFDVYKAVQWSRRTGILAKELRPIELSPAKRSGRLA